MEILTVVAATNKSSLELTKDLEVNFLVSVWSIYIFFFDKLQEYNFDVKVCMTMIDRTQTHLKLNYSSKHHIDQENELQQLRISCHIA